MRYSLVKRSPNIFKFCDGRRHMNILQAAICYKLAKLDLFMDKTVHCILRPIKLPQCCYYNSRKSYSTTFLVNICRCYSIVSTLLCLLCFFQRMNHFSPFFSNLIRNVALMHCSLVKRLPDICKSYDDRRHINILKKLTKIGKRCQHFWTASPDSGPGRGKDCSTRKGFRDPSDWIRYFDHKGGTTKCSGIGWGVQHPPKLECHKKEFELKLIVYKISREPLFS